MGTITKGILGGFSGTVGTIVGANWRGKDIIRSRPKPSSRQPSEKQLLQQEKFKLVTQFLRPISAIQKMYFGNRSGAQSRNNLATAYTINEAVMVNAGVPELIFSKVLITKGELTGFQNLLVTPQAGNILSFSWTDNSTQGNAQTTDVLGIACYCASEKEFVVTDNAVNRSALTASITLPAHLAAKNVEVYAYFRNQEETSASNSLYLGSHTLV